MKPIIFSTHMVQAILDGRKTMTRRVIKIPSYLWENPTILQPDCCAMFHYGAGGCQNHSSVPLFVNSKYQVGDVLWVRETFVRGYSLPYGEWIYYKASFKNEVKNPKWKPSIFMPKEACRIFLRVTNVRVERLKDISEEDCLKEGMPIEEKGLDVFLLWWMSLWNSTAQDAYKWEDNPYVFVYEFQRIEKQN